MKLESIVTLANRAVRLRFAAMERSLRATGCDAPLKVIPYDDDRFELPAGAEWWEVPAVTAWLARWGAHPTMRKYQCLLTGGYQFVDADVCFLRNPAGVLEPMEGFVTSCGHWHNPGHTLTPESQAWLAARSTTWQKNVFNTGQWACDRVLYDFAALAKRAEAADFAGTCLTFPYHEQPGVNLLVNASGVAISNLTLPPWNMASTWAGDYPGEFAQHWRTPATTPYLIHWAGTRMDAARPIDEIFLNYLTAAERAEWQAQTDAERRRREAEGRSWKAKLRRVRRAGREFWRTLRET